MAIIKQSETFLNRFRSIGPTSCGKDAPPLGVSSIVAWLMNRNKNVYAVTIRPETQKKRDCTMAP